MEKYCFKEDVQTAYERLQHPLAIYQYVEGRVMAIVLSDGFCEMFGYEDQAHAYKSIEEDLLRGVHPEDLAKIRSEIYRFTSEGGNYEAIYRICPENGSDYKVIRAVGKHVCMDRNVNLAHIWYTDESSDVNHKIMELQGSVASLLANMPAMTFSKDVNTRKYLACNQAFADYAHKDAPEGVVGLTDFEIFDAETAEHFIEDDKKALAMDKPYIFYEDVPDAAGNPRQFQTTKLKFIDATGRECLLGLCQDVTDAMRIKREYVEKLAIAQNQAEIDELTGIKNKNAFKKREDLMNSRILERRQPEFAIIVLDVNDLKKINDTLGHEAGDKCIRNACEIICKTFERSPVYRVGGDEFVVISQDEDYERTEELVDAIAKHNEDAMVNGGIIIACGMAKYDNDNDVTSVFNRADRVMYDNKKYLKEHKG